MTTYNLGDVAERSSDLEQFYTELTEFEESYDVAQLLNPDSFSASISQGEFYINPDAADRELFLHKQGKKNRRPVSAIESLGYRQHRDTEFEDLIGKKMQSGPFRGHDIYELAAKIGGKITATAGFGGIAGEALGYKTGLIGAGAVLAGVGTLSAAHRYSEGVNSGLDERIKEMVDQEYAEIVVDERGDIPVNTVVEVPSFEDEEMEGEFMASKWEKLFLKNLDLNRRAVRPAAEEL